MIFDWEGGNHMLTIDALRDAGVRVEDGLARCFGREDFYLRLVRIALADANFAKLEAAAAAGDMDAGFEAAHALKGALANLDLTPVLEPVKEITEKFRARVPGDYRAEVAAILAERDRLAALDE